MREDWIEKSFPKVTVPEGKKGPWTVARFEVEDSLMGRLRERHFVPGTYTKLVHERRGLVMSDTPAERLDHLEFVQEARGDVLISGLGLGMCIGAIKDNPEVDSITVIEIDQDVIDLVGPHYACDKLTIIKADIFEWKPPKGVTYGAVWHDVWDAICRDNLPEMATLNRRYARKADWKGCWAQDLCKEGY